MLCNNEPGDRNPFVYYQLDFGKHYQLSGFVKKMFCQYTNYPK